MQKCLVKGNLIRKISIKPVFDPLEGIDLIQISVWVGEEPYPKGMITPHLYIKAYHKKDTMIDIWLCPEGVTDLYGLPSKVTEKATDSPTTTD